MIHIGLEQQVQVRGGDGTILWQGGVSVGSNFVATSGEATNSAQIGEGVTWDSTNSTVARLETTAAGAVPSSDLPMLFQPFFKRIATATDVGFMGVTMQPAGPAKLAMIAGEGSIVTVQTTATLLALGASVGGSATVGKTAAVAKGTTGLTLGICIKTNDNTATGTNSPTAAGVYFAGIAVAPG